MALDGKNVPGVSFSPALSEISLPADQPSLKTQVTLRNRSAVTQTYALSVVDFGSLDEQGGVAFLGAPSSELDHQYGLASWMKPDLATVQIPGGGSVDITLTVENRPTLAAGGHYGAILATEQSTPGAADTASEFGGNVPVDKKTIETEVAVQSGDTVLLGGLIQQSDTTSNNGVPGLKNIPLLGRLFGSSGHDKSRKELLVLITPTVVRGGAEDATELTEEYKKRFLGLEPLINDMEQAERARREVED